MSGRLSLNDFTFGCHGIPERCFKVNGRHLPFCARCAGAGVGHIGGAINFFVAPMVSVVFFPVGLAVMLADWVMQNKLHWYHSNFSRFVTGIMGGYSVAMVIWWVVGLVVRWVTG